ncbi:MAG: HAD family hydrolase [Proteobacteria bacterium]|nr:HAD family hydrolase [Pseudomonadota bacterium]
MSGTQRAVFLDRDGVLIRDVHYLSDLKDVEFYPDVPEGLRVLKKCGFKLIMVTNQSGVARGFFTEEFVHRVYEEMNRHLDRSGIQLDALYYCPHHPHGKPPYDVECSCRKPSPGMIRQAVQDHNIETGQSYMIGDKRCDVELAVNSKLSGILLETGYGRQDAKPVRAAYPQIPIFPTFSKAVDFIVSRI